jgi:hypothetical protein
MENCAGTLRSELRENQSDRHDLPPGQQRKNSHDDKRRGSNDNHGKGHGNKKH